VLCCPAVYPGIDDFVLQQGLPYVVLSGTDDEQVPYARLINFCERNRKRLGSGSFRWHTVVDRHALQTCVEQTGAQVVENGEGSLGLKKDAPETKDSKNGNKRLFLRELIQEAWDLRLKVAGYDHSKRFPSTLDSSSPSARRQQRGRNEKTCRLL